jgi:hypothetical protein
VARNVFASDERKLSLATTLLNFTTFCRSVGAGVPRAWGNGATADITWIEYALAMGSVGLGAPWHFTNIRDMRTIIDAADLDLRDIPPVGTAHNALDDAIFQANAISAAWQKIRRAMGLLEMPQKGTKAAVAVQSQDEDDEL